MARLRIFKANLLLWARNPNPCGRGWFWTRISQRVNIASSTNIREILPIINWSLLFLSPIWRLTGFRVVGYELTQLHSENTALRGRKHYMGSDAGLFPDLDERASSARRYCVRHHCFAKSTRSFFRKFVWLPYLIYSMIWYTVALRCGNGFPATTKMIPAVYTLGILGFLMAI